VLTNKPYADVLVKILPKLKRIEKLPPTFAAKSKTPLAYRLFLV